MEATASDTSVLARMLSWFFRIVSLKTVPISEQHMIAIHNALFMMAGEFVSQSATTDQPWAEHGDGPSSTAER